MRWLNPPHEKKEKRCCDVFSLIRAQCFQI